MKRAGKSKIRIILLIAVIMIVVLAVAYMFWEKAPDIAEEKTIVTEVAEPSPTTAAETAETAQEPTPEPTQEPIQEPEPTVNPLDEAVAPESLRQDGVYTVLIVGEDKWTGNTDTILVGKIDTKAHKMDFVSLPRDTLINVDWDVRKLNSVYYKARSAGQDPAEQLKFRVKQLTGFEVDCYAVVNLEAFIEVIDAIGGIEYDVPQDIYFEDYTMVDGQWQDSYHGIYAGKQTLDGLQCMGLVRYRYGYEGGDLDRIELQHDFLNACVDQFVSLGNIPNVGKVIDILAKNIDTDLSAANIAFFFRQALMCAPEDINFYTMPVTPKMLNGYSYAVILVYQWRDMINELLNPYNEPITINSLNVMFNDYIGIGCTGEVCGPWYYVGAAEADLAQLYGGQG